MNDSLVSILRWRSEHQPERHGYSFLGDGETEDLRLSYAQLDRQARTIAARLQQTAAVGDRAILLYPPGPDYLAAFFGCLYAGVIAIPAYPPRLGQIQRSLPRLQSIVSDARPQIALSNAAIISAVAPLSATDPRFAGLSWIATDALPDDLADTWTPHTISAATIALLQYTSGSTAAPKGVVLRHGNLLHNSAHIQRCFDHSADSCGVIWLPPYHDMGLIGGIIQPLYVGFPVVLMPPIAFLQRPLRWLQAVSRYGATTSGGPNFAYELCVRKIPVEQRASLDLSRWRVAFTGAEPVRAETLELFAAAFAGCGFRRKAFYPCYGLAEATLIVSGGPTEQAPVLRQFVSAELQRHRAVVATADEPRQTLVGCGSTLPGQQIVIAQPDTLSTCAPGEIGEILVAGSSVAAGYWEREAETAQTFSAFLADSGAGPFLRTGDLGFLHDGELFITGRRKELIILRGRNHYPQDIELTVERSHPALRPGCGAAFTIELDGEERLAVVQEVERQQRMSIDPNSVAAAIRQAVAAEHDVQVYAVVLVRPGSVPKTSSGKIQRQLCRSRLLAKELDVIGDSVLSASQSDVPTDDLSAEELRALLPDQQRQALASYLIARLGQVVGVAASGLGPQQPISALGIDSLAAVEIQYRLERDLGIAVPMVLFLKDLSIAALADEIAALLADSPQSPRPAAPVESAADGRYPLSYGQRALWFLQQLAPEQGIYNIVAAVRIGPELDTEVLRRALQQLVERHSPLRSSFGAVNGEPFQQIHQQISLSFEITDASDWSTAELDQRLLKAGYAPFDLQNEPPLRIRLYRQADGSYVLLLAIHHIVSDFWSLGVLVRELDLLYSAERQEQTAPLAPLPIDYPAYTHRQRELLASADADRLWQYWQRQLTGAPPVLDLPLDYSRPPLQSYHGATARFSLDPALSRQIKALAHDAGTTIYTTLLAAFQVLLHRYSGQDDLLIGSPSVGRDTADLAGLIGYFVNPVLLRARLGDNPPFTTFLAQVRQTVLAALEHQSYPFPLLVERLDLARSADRSPLFQVMFLVQKAAFGDEGLTRMALNVPGAAIQIGKQRAELMPLEQPIARFDLTLTMADLGEELAGVFEYNRDLFAPRTIARMAEHFRILLERIVAAPEQRVAELPLLTDAELLLLRDWNATTTEYPRDSTIAQMIEAQAARTPDSPAIVFAGTTLTYAELNARANQLAHHLIAQGVGPELLVAICADRSLDLIVGMLAILKTGGAYVPLDPAYPAERVRYMLAHSRARVLLTQERLVATLPEHGAQVFRLDADWSSLTAQPTSNPVQRALPEHLAYLIFTSGSTGRPKGVAITHSSAVALMAWAQTVFTSADLAGVLAATSICFDLSIFELFLPLVVGGTVILAENVLHLPQLVSSHPVTLINTVPSAMAELLRLGGVPDTVRTVNLAGEPLPAALVAQIYQQTSAKQVFNLYGPSEDTTYSTWALIPSGSRPPLPIGKPIANTQAYLLNRQGQPQPIGVPGELYLGGDGLARGYLHQPDLTAERFVPDPFGQRPGARLYRSGDLARCRPDGTLEFLGRSDQQVKLRGFRIETGEIESVLTRHPAVAECVVVLREDVPGDQRLVAYLRHRNVPEKHGEAHAQPAEHLVAKLRQFLHTMLPDYMVPSAFVLLDALPHTPSGKIDRRALPAPQQSPSDSAYVAPRTPTEEIIAGIWAELLQRERVGIHDHFFALGGHSLLAVQLLSRLRDTFQIDIPLHTLFNTSTVAALSAAVEDIVLEMIEGLTDDEVLQLSQSQPLGEQDRL